MPTIEPRRTRLHYVDEGTGPSAVLLLHAFPLHAGMWERQIAVLRRRHRVIAPDYPGLGRSAPRAEPSTMSALAEGVLAILDAAGVERAAVVGLSMGGYLAFELLRRAPDRFRGAALCDTRAGADTPDAAAAREAFAQRALERGLDWVADETLPRLLRSRPDPAVAAEVRRLIREGTTPGVAAAQRGMARRPDSTPALGAIRCPTLVVVGDEDALTVPAESRALAAGIPGARLVELGDAGHLSSLENPDAFDGALVPFLDGLGP